MIPPPAVVIPPSDSSVSVSIIDTTAWAYKIPCSDLFKPRFPGLDTMDLCSYAFLITHNQLDRRVLFDLGIRKDWENLIPATVRRLKETGVIVTVEKKLVDILRDGGTDPSKIEAVVWSHIHWDHTGNLADLPATTKLIVGPEIKNRFMPGWPRVPDAHFHESDVAGRLITGLEADNFNIDIGGLRGHDYFGDGSFYILDAPGHSLGHINALARTSADPETFVLLAADSVHLGGELRPTKALPLPDSIDIPEIVPRPCPREELLKIHPRSSHTLPYLGLDPCFPEHLEDAERTIECIEKFDSDNRVLVVFAHDVSLYNTLEFYPALANDWKRKGWKSTGRWAYLVDLQKIARERKLALV
ncbi:beta-lactamase-like protein [Nemania sp. FL0031]|nr:beta-lactamase-like protein [Nemania sp. FL0031]